MFLSRVSPYLSWLLSEHPMFVRTSFDKYEERVNLFLKEVLSRVKDLQFYTSNGSKGGPIIAVQVCFDVINYVLI